MNLFLYILTVTVVIITVQSKVLWKSCEGRADIGELPSKGVFPSVCVTEHSFNGESHAWSFSKSIVRNSNFTACVFADRPKRGQNYQYTTWMNVIFKDSIFQSFDELSDQIKFEHTYFEDVLFENCTFDTSANVLFSNFAFSRVEFRNCTFHSELVAKLGTIQNLRFWGCMFGPRHGKVNNNGEGSVRLSQVSVDRLSIESSVSKGELRIQQSSVASLNMFDAELESFVCHEATIGNREPELTSELNDTMMRKVSFTDGMYCDHTRFRGLEMHNIAIRNAIDFQNSKLDRVAILNVTSLSNETCSTFDMSYAEMGGDRLSNINTTKGTFQETVFSDAVLFDGFSILETHFTLNDTVFSTEQINNECCTESCVSRGCKCDVSITPLFCPVGDSSVNVNVKGSCFPAAATVSVVRNSGQIVRTIMQDLQHGQRVLHTRDSSATDVFFFGHRSRKFGLYVVVTSYANKGPLGREKYSLSISPEHLVPVAGRGLIPARRVQLGDALYTEDGNQAVVKRIENKFLEGMYAPTTLKGELAVNGIQVSCYTEIVPAWLAHAALIPLRAFYGLGVGARVLLERADLLHEKSFATLARKVGSVMSVMELDRDKTSVFL